MTITESAAGLGPAHAGAAIMSGNTGQKSRDKRMVNNPFVDAVRGCFQTTVRIQSSIGKWDCDIAKRDHNGR